MTQRRRRSSIPHAASGFRGDFVAKQGGGPAVVFGGEIHVRIEVRLACRSILSGIPKDKEGKEEDTELEKREIPIQISRNTDI